MPTSAAAGPVGGELGKVGRREGCHKPPSLAKEDAVTWVFGIPKREEDEKKTRELIQRFIERTLTDGLVSAALGAGRGAKTRGGGVICCLGAHASPLDHG